MNSEFKAQLTSEIQRIEGLSSVEIIPAIILSSAKYTAQRNVISLIGVIFSLFLYVVFSPMVELWQMALVGALSFLFFSLLFLKLELLLFFVPKSDQRRQVEKRAYSLFLDNEVFATRDRSGLLIMVSELEKAVYILADKGLVEKISAEFWQELSVKLASDFDEKSPGSSFFLALKEIEADLVKFFPVKNDDTNELSDHLR